MQVTKELVLAFIGTLKECSTTRNHLKIRKLHCQTIKQGFSFLESIRTSLFISYATCGQMEDAQLMFSFIDYRPTLLYENLIRGYSSIKEFHLSLDSFNQMLLDDKDITINTIPAVLKSVAAISSLRLGQQLHSYAWVRGFMFDFAHNNSLNMMYGKCADLPSARKVFDEMSERNRISWCTMMNGYGIHGEYDEVFYLFHSMCNCGVRPDALTFSTVLTACSHGGKLEEGKMYFKMMVDRFELRPNLQHYTCMVDMLGRAGKIDEAKGVIESMEMEPDEALWRAFLRACSFHGRHEVAVRGQVFRLADQ